MKVALAQVNPTMGDFEGNMGKIEAFIERAQNAEADLVAFPEMVVSGYPPQDLLYERSFVRANKTVVAELAKKAGDMLVVLGFVDFDEDWRLYNSAAVLGHRRQLAVIHKTLLPTYDVFDEARYFQPNDPQQIRPVTAELKGRQTKVGIEICEDLWDHDYDTKVTDLLVQRGAEFVVNISASPFYVGKRFEREGLLREKATANGIPMLMVNLVGGQDELVFDGQSMVVDASGETVRMGQQFEEDLVLVDFEFGTAIAKETRYPSYDKDEEVFSALVLGIRDYFRKTGFERAVLGISGGIDSAITACVAVEALGAKNVVAFSMPSKFSSRQSRTDAEEIARNLGIFIFKFSIHGIVDSYRRTLDRPLGEVRTLFGLDKSKDDPVADENLQPRARGNCLMDFSNRLKELRMLVLNTGNKTELALGYCTLYGDMSGGVGVIGDVSKLQVYRLAEYINRRAGRDVIPRSTISKKPSPELKEGQFDPFDFAVVSPMVDEIVENRRSKQELIEMGYPRSTVEDVYGRVRRAEYKRFQAPPYIKITKKAFGTGWKMPIVNRYRG